MIELSIVSEFVVILRSFGIRKRKKTQITVTSTAAAMLLEKGTTTLFVPRAAVWREIFAGAKVGALCAMVAPAQYNSSHSEQYDAVFIATALRSRVSSVQFRTFWFSQ